MRSLYDKGRRLFPPKILLSILAGTAISAFGMVNIHQRVHITEGGVLGMILLLNYWFHIPASLLSPILDAISYAAGFKYLGKAFLPRSIAATLSLAFFLRFWEVVPFRLPDLSAHPLLAAVFGACFVGVGVGIIVRQGISSGGDDALALVISKITGCKISRAYLATDLTVLALSLSYIPVTRIAYSLVTVTVSSLLIDAVSSFRVPERLGEKAGRETAG
ncbi:MAG TPA: YitT family protein [Candidatus Eisenbergiella merdavium]|uniref:YitT family protein n=1 Tax=Candidatus Eisenbergiella merdavium TaxID=2838551 RepID=A0A9D2SNI4_9FIRM|nr:YitT family protein [Candidatus Eisenbergiella merdavium]